MRQGLFTFVQQEGEEVGKGLAISSRCVSHHKPLHAIEFLSFSQHIQQGAYGAKVVDNCARQKLGRLFSEAAAVGR